MAALSSTAEIHSFIFWCLLFIQYSKECGHLMLKSFSAVLETESAKFHKLVIRELEKELKTFIQFIQY